MIFSTKHNVHFIKLDIVECFSGQNLKLGAQFIKVSMTRKGHQSCWTDLASREILLKSFIFQKNKKPCCQE